MKYKLISAAVLVTVFFTFTECKTKNEDKKGEVIPAAREVSPAKPDSSVSVYQAALVGDLSLVSMHIDNGFDVNIPDEEGRTTLMFAAYNGNILVLKKLLEKKASVNLQDVRGRTALMMASSGPYPDAVKLLLDHFADPDITDKEEHFTALMFAAAEGQLEVVRVLLSHKADPALKDIDGDDAFTFALNNGHNEVAALLQSVKTK